MVVEFRVLGPVEAAIDGEPVDLGPARQVCVLALLLVEVNHVVPTDRLLERVWPDRLPHSARGTLSSYLSRLRRCLAPAGDTALSRKSGGYVLTADSDAVDLHRFHTLLNRARTAGDDGHASVLLTEALGLWRDGAFTGVDCAWLDRLGETLAGERRAARRDWTDLQLRLGHHGVLVPGLVDQVEDDPLDERLVGQLMLAQYRAGRQAEALDTFTRARLRLRHDLGVSPGGALRRLHQEILSTASALEPPRPNRTRRPRQLPAAPAMFTGRARELADLTQAHATGHGALVTIVGPAGVGKTWLALRWAHDHTDQFADGQLHADLRGFDPVEQPTAPAAVVRSFLVALGVGPEDIPLDTDAQSAYYRTLLADKQTLILLDNARDAAQVIPLLPGGSRCCVLVTSRNDLAALSTLHSARPLAVDLLDHEQSHRILDRYLGARRIAHDTAAVTAIVRCCAGLPLALGIIGARAARHPGFPLAHLADELADTTTRLDALDAGDLRADLRAVLSCSYRALAPEPARVFRLLGHTIGADICLAAAARLADRTESATRDSLNRLHEAHLVRQHAPGRYQMHDLPRLFSRGLTEKTEGDAAVSRLLDYYVDTATKEISVSGRLTTAWLDAEFDNLVAASDRALELDMPTYAWKLTDALCVSRYYRGHSRNWIDSLTHTLAVVRERGDRVGEAATTKNLGVAHFWYGSYDEALACFTRAVDLAGRTGDHRVEVGALNNIAMIYVFQGRFTDASRLFDRMARCIDRNGAFGTSSRFVANSALALVHLGRLTEAFACCDRALRHQRESGLHLQHALTLVTLGVALRHSGRCHEAVDRLSHAATRLHHLGNLSGAAQALNELGETYLAMGDPASAVHAYDEALGLARAAVHSYDQARAHAGIARSTQSERTSHHRAAALALFTRLGIQPHEQQRLLSRTST